jgi:hypothetical protein
VRLVFSPVAKLPAITRFYQGVWEQAPVLKENKRGGRDEQDFKVGQVGNPRPIFDRLRATFLWATCRRRVRSSYRP